MRLTEIITVSADEWIRRLEYARAKRHRAFMGRFLSRDDRNFIEARTGNWGGRFLGHGKAEIADNPEPRLNGLYVPVLGSLPVHRKDVRSCDNCGGTNGHHDAGCNPHA